MNMENHGRMISIGETPDSSARALLQSSFWSHLVAKQEELEKEMINFSVRIISSILTLSETEITHLSNLIR
jgi:hypothetical protein